MIYLHIYLYDYDDYIYKYCILFTDIVNLDLKSTLRVLYNLFTKYKSMN